MTIRDYYSGYEPEPEFVVVAETGADEQVVRSWIGHIDRIFGCMKPGPSGWTSLARAYHLSGAWLDESPWYVDHLQAAEEQWERVQAADLDSETAAVHAAIGDLMSQAVANGWRVRIEYS